MERSTHRVRVDGIIDSLSSRIESVRVSRRWAAPIEDNRKRCPRCEREECSRLPPTNPQSELEWFQCGSCQHMWAVQRDYATETATCS